MHGMRLSAEFLAPQPLLLMRQGAVATGGTWRRRRGQGRQPGAGPHRGQWAQAHAGQGCGGHYHGWPDAWRAARALVPCSWR
jgi:hypothetical protein